MDDGVVVLRVAEQGHELAHTLEVKLGFGEFGGMFQAIIYEAVEVIEGVLIGCIH